MKYTNDDFPDGTIITGTFGGQKQHTIYNAKIIDSRLTWGENIDDYNTNAWSLDNITIIAIPQYEIFNYEIY